MDFKFIKEIIKLILPAIIMELVDVEKYPTIFTLAFIVWLIQLYELISLTFGKNRD